MSNRELLEGALKRVNALAGVSGKLYNDNTGWFIIWKNHVFDESARTAGEMISYLHGIEDALKFRKATLEEIQRKADKELEEEYKTTYAKYEGEIPSGMFDW